MLAILLKSFALVAAITLGATKKRVVAGGRRTVYVDVTGPASYTAGGELLVDGDLNSLMPDFGGSLKVAGPPGDFNKVEFFESEIDAASGRFCVLNRATGKMMYYAGAAEVAAATNLSALVLKCRVEYQLMPTG